MKICLDTNFIWGWFENAIKAYRKNHEEYETGQFDSTRKMEFLVETKYELFTTNVAKAEVFRKLYSEKTVDVHLCRRIWEDFVTRFSIVVLDVDEIEFNEVAEMCLMAKLGKGSIPNLIQLQFAKKQTLYFATGDGAIKEDFINYYEKIYTYIRLRQIYDDEKTQRQA